MARKWEALQRKDVDTHAKSWQTVFGETFTCADFTMALLQHAEPLLPSDVKDDQITVTLKPGAVKGVKQGRAHGAAVGYEITGPKSFQIELTLYRRAGAVEEREIYIDERNFSGLGGGAGKRFHRNLLPVCDAQKITCFTNLPMLGGTFVWARFGFLPSQAAWKAMREEARRRLSVLRDAGVLERLPAGEDRAGLVVVEHALHEDAPAAVRTLAHPKAPELTGESVALLKQKNVYGLPDSCALSFALLYGIFWFPGGGILDLKDPETRAYHEAYIAGNDAEVRQQLGIAEILKQADPKTTTATTAHVEAATGTPAAKAATESATGTG